MSYIHFRSLASGRNWKLKLRNAPSQQENGNQNEYIKDCPGRNVIISDKEEIINNLISGWSIKTKEPKKTYVYYPEVNNVSNIWIMTGTHSYSLHYSISINLYAYIKLSRFSTVFIKRRNKIYQLSSIEQIISYNQELNITFKIIFSWKRWKEPSKNRHLLLIIIFTSDVTQVASIWQPPGIMGKVENDIMVKEKNINRTSFVQNNKIVPSILKL